MRRFTVTLSVVLSLVLSRQAMGAQTPIDLERYKAELRAKGEKLLLTELDLPLSTNVDETACRNLFETNTIARPKMVPRVLDYAREGYVREAWKGDLRLEYGTGSWSDLEKQVAANEPQMKLIRRALEHPAPDWGKIQTDQLLAIASMPLTTDGSTREVAVNFVCAVVCALHRKDIDDAVENMHSLASMPRLFRNESSTVWNLYRMTVASVIAPMIWEVLQAPGLKDAQLARLQNDLEQFNALDPVERGIMGKRAFSQAWMLLVRGADDPKTPEEIDEVRKLFLKAQPKDENANSATFDWPTVFSAKRGYSADADELVQLEYFQKTLSGIRMLKTKGGWLAARQVVSNACDELETKLREDKKHLLLVASIADRSFERALLRGVKTETERRLAIAAIAIKRYELKHGSPPIELSVLVPAYLAAVPIDPMNGKPLRYQINADWTFGLYSVGLDGVDNGGDYYWMDFPAKAPPTYGIWQRDAVWPRREISSSPELSSNSARSKGN